MDILKPFLKPKKLRKLQNNPKAFFKDALNKRIVPIQNQLKSLKPKKNHGFAEYYIISAVYNVEKYLDDYFNSILKQRLDFTNNITILCIDDGSTDNSAKIIQKYQKKFPKNIVYLHKENGGQGSARNLGIQWLQEKLGYTNTESCKEYSILGNKSIWVTFTDPDDFLDRDYFYEVDKFLGKNTNQDICMIACNLIFYYEAKNIFSDSHPLRHKFKDKETIKNNKNLQSFIQLSMATTFIKFSEIPNGLYCDEDLKPNFEDAKFINEFLIANLNSKSVFLRDARYFYRKRSDGTSTLDNKQDSDLKQILKMGYLLLLLLCEKKIGYIPVFIQNTILYDLFWQIQTTLNNSNKFSFHTPQEREEFFALWDKIFSLIETQRILEFNLAGCWFYHKVGILNCFKDEYPPFQITYIDEFDATKEMIKIKYFTPDKDDIESIRFDHIETYADYHKIQQLDFCDRVFVYCKHLWVKVPKNAGNIEIFIRGQRAGITFNGKQHQSLEVCRIYSKFQQVGENNNLWLLMDRDIRADDNAEHLYRYIATNFSHQNIVFALRKDSEDWERLQNDRFKLVEFGSQEFKKALKSCNKVISSHIDNYLVKHLGKDTLKGKDFVFLQHGVTKDDISNWLNSGQINSFITATKREYHSIVDDFTHYKFGSKEVKLTGLARHDSLLTRAKVYEKKSKKRQILVMPTWRKYLAGQTTGIGNDRTYNHQLLESQYFKKWKHFLNSQKLREFCKRYNFQILFNPHQEIIPYINSFLCDFVQINTKGDSLQKLLAESTLMVTDYSSIAFDMAYINKPILYYQFDKEEFFDKHWQKGYFDYDKDGFGAVVNTEEDLFKELEKLLQNDCKIEEPYKTNIKNTFEFKDGKCCERIYQEILELDKPYKRKWTLDDVLRLASNALKAKCYKEASERFRFVLEHLGESEFSTSQVVLDEEIILNYLLASRLNRTSQEALEFISSQEYESKLALSNKVKLEIIKNYFEILDTKEAIARLEDLRIEILEQELLEFAHLKLRIYAYLSDKQKLKEVYNELKDAYNVDKKDLGLDLFLLQNKLINFKCQNI